MSSLNNLSRDIQNELKRYAKLVKEDVVEAQEETAEVLVDDIKRDSPERRPSYKNGWRVKKVGKNLVVHNKTDYQLTHLLEHGHLAKNGERVKAKVHIRPNADKAERKYLEKIERAIER
jgi:type II secretory pathway predicted ATPase ExeA